MRTITLFGLLLLVHGASMAQLTFYKVDKRGKETAKGAFLELELKAPQYLGDLPVTTSDQLELTDLNGSDSVVLESVLVTTVLPMLIKGAVAGAQLITSKDPSKYEANHQTLEVDHVILGQTGSFTMNAALRLKYYEKGKTTAITAIEWTLVIEYTQSDRSMHVKSIQEQYTFLPIKTKSKYDYVIEHLALEMQVLLEETHSIEGKPDKKVLKIKKLDALNLTSVMPNFESDRTLRLGADGSTVYIPMENAKVASVELKGLIIGAKASFTNPYGAAPNPAGDFFENNGDSIIEALMGFLTEEE